MKVKAYFGSLKNANKTLERLKSAGFNHSFLDNDNYIGEDPLSTSDPMVSSIGSTNEIPNVNYCVVIDMDEGNSSLAREIVIDMGGMIDNPNVNRYETIARTNISVEKPDGQGNQIYTKRQS